MAERLGQLRDIPQHEPIVIGGATHGIDDVVKGCKDKAAAVAQLMSRDDLPREAVCFMGDDVNDVAAMDLAGFSAAPADARPEALHQADLVTHAGGGNGAVRELIDLVLSGTGNPACSRLSGGAHTHRENVGQVGNLGGNWQQPLSP